MVTFKEIFEKSEIKEVECEVKNQVQDFTDEQKIAFIKAILYVISADNVITDEEKKYLSQLCVEIGTTNDIVEKAIMLSDEKMFELLETVTDEQEQYIMMCLNNAANADQVVAEEEKEFIDLFSKTIHSGEKPVEFYNKILTF
jgi:uncharacterized membrane protein YebE (DUF533 family)